MFRFISDEILATKESKPGVQLGTIKPNAHPVSATANHCLAGSFDGVNTMLDFIKEDMSVPKRSESSSQYGATGFNTFESYEKAWDAFRNNPGTLDREKEAGNSLFQFTSSGNEVDYDVTGEYIDMGRFMSGEPECFGSNVQGRINKRVRLIFGVGASSIVKSEVIHKRSLYFSQVVDWLEGNGIRTELIGFNTSHCEYIEIVVKRFEDIFNYNDLLVVSHPDFFRRIIFRFIEYSPSWAPGYGNVRINAEFFSNLYKDPQMLEFSNNEHTVFYNSSDVEGGKPGVDKSIKKLKDWLEKVLPEPITCDSERITII